MHKLLAIIGINLRELANLLLMNQRTLQSKLTRNAGMKAFRETYLQGIKMYAQEQLPIDDTVQKAVIVAKLALDQEMDKQMKERTKLTLEHSRLTLKHDQLQNRMETLVQRFHFVEHYRQYLPPAQQEEENTLHWLSLIRKESEYRYEKLWAEDQKTLQRMAGISAELAFLNGSE